MEVKGYPEYLIYDDGRVLSKRRNRFMKITKDTKGYNRIKLMINKKRGDFKIHRLVAEHYIPNPENKPQVNHINGDKSNNHISNLEWVTNMENINSYRSIYKSNSSGHKGISHHQLNSWRYQKTYYGKNISKYFKSKTDALCYKYIILLKIKAKIN